MAKQTKITKSAKGEDCTLGPSLVTARVMKRSYFVILAKIEVWRLSVGIISVCMVASANCHKIIDGQVKSEFSKSELAEIKLIALERTQQKLIDKGLFRVMRFYMILNIKPGIDPDSKADGLAQWRSQS